MNGEWLRHGTNPRTDRAVRASSVRGRRRSSGFAARAVALATAAASDADAKPYVVGLTPLCTDPARPARSRRSDYGRMATCS